MICICTSTSQKNCSLSLSRLQNQQYSLREYHYQQQCYLHRNHHHHSHHLVHHHYHHPQSHHRLHPPPMVNVKGCLIMSFTAAVNSSLSTAFKCNWGNWFFFRVLIPSLYSSRGPMGSAPLSWPIIKLGCQWFSYWLSVTVNLHFVLFCFLGLPLVFLLFTFPTFWLRVCCLKDVGCTFLVIILTDHYFPDLSCVEGQLFLLDCGW